MGNEFILFIDKFYTGEHNGLTKFSGIVPLEVQTFEYEELQKPCIIVFFYNKTNIVRIKNKNVALWSKGFPKLIRRGNLAESRILLMEFKDPPPYI